MKTEERPYFLGGTQRVIQVSEFRKYSVIPQPRGMEVHQNLFEVALLEKGSGTEILGAFLTEEEVQALLGARLLSGIL